MTLVDTTRDGAVALVRLNRPPVNALSTELAIELQTAFTECAAPAIRAVVVTGQPHFAAGADIKGFQESYESGATELTASSLVAAAGALEALEKPTIAAIHGYALGGGLELSLAADFRYLAEDAKVGQPEILLGIIPGAGGTQRLPRVIGFQKAKELVYSGRHVGADEALAIGLADRVAPTDEVLDLALKDAGEWATKATRGIAAAKKALHGGWGRSLEDGMQAERAAFEEVFWTDDAKDGVAAFIEKRSADFKGR